MDVIDELVENNREFSSRVPRPDLDVKNRAGS